ncbi:MAG: Stp1/IreP family PP2C-type Ser/Thr phosphatase [Actinobacteria bacterium]|nr:MAG: Stp1/IreP family PP2C-type Ser/Thr phosphatase [Actinomycetota bacterium]
MDGRSGKAATASRSASQATPQRRDRAEVRSVTVTQLGYGTDTGKKRRRNEDDYVVEPPLFAIADGMGGAQAGELASSLAAGAVREDEGAAGSGERRVAELIQEANRRVYERSSQDAAASGMGTTMTVALAGDGNVAFGHVGDSRAYLIRDGKLEQLTEDHSLVAELVRSGKLSPEEAETHPQRSVITRALGTDPDVDVDTFSIEALPGDLFMLCSDGLTSMVEDDVILRCIEKNRDNLQASRSARTSESRSRRRRSTRPLAQTATARSTRTRWTSSTACRPSTRWSYRPATPSKRSSRLSRSAAPAAG